MPDSPNQPVYGDILELIDRAGDNLLDRSKVIDALLDLRSAAADDQLLRDQLDGVLRSVPGKSLVERTWWLGTLADLAETANRPPAAATAPAC